MILTATAQSTLMNSSRAFRWSCCDERVRERREKAGEERESLGEGGEKETEPSGVVVIAKLL